MTVSLTGFMGSGKSSTGKVLSGLLGCPFIDLDTYIESKEGKRIRDIFRDPGEQRFREMEYDALSEILPAEDSRTDISLVLALGGGTVTCRKSLELIRSRSTCFYLKASPDTLEERLKNETEGRPVLDSGSPSLKERISTLLSDRAGQYESAADYTIETDMVDVQTAAELISDMIKGLKHQHQG